MKFLHARTRLGHNYVRICLLCYPLYIETVRWAHMPFKESYLNAGRVYCFRISSEPDQIHDI
jgi:hypothetical protein